LIKLVPMLHYHRIYWMTYFSTVSISLQDISTNNDIHANWSATIYSKLLWVYQTYFPRDVCLSMLLYICIPLAPAIMVQTKIYFQTKHEAATHITGRGGLQKPTDVKLDMAHYIIIIIIIVIMYMPTHTYVNKVFLSRRHFDAGPKIIFIQNRMKRKHSTGNLNWK